MTDPLDSRRAGRAEPPSTTVDAPPLSPLSASRLGELIAALGQLDRVLALPTGVDAGEPLAFGRFRLTRRLGEGRFGVALLGRDPASGRPVVVKVPQPSTLADPGWVARMSWEGRAAARLDHPGVVPLYEVGTADGLPYLVTAYVAGPTLAEYAERRGGRLAPQDAARVVRAVALAVHHAHGRGVLHCDLKPGNVLVDPCCSGPGAVPGVGTPRVADFGLARLLDEGAGGLTRVAGTLAYMAPEQAAGDRGAFSARTDVYALGGVLRDLLLGTRPDPVEAALGACTPRAAAPPPPPDLGAIARKCLAPAPCDRYGSALELADDLGHFLARRPTSARPLSKAHSLARWVRCRPVSAAGALAGLALVLAGVAAAGRYSARLSAAEAGACAAAEHASISEFYADLERLRQRRADPRPGWAEVALAEIRRLAPLPPAGQPGAREALRTEAVAALTAVDLRPVRELGVGFKTHSLAFAPDGRTVALGGWGAEAGRVRVKLVDAAGARADAELDFPADAAWEARRGRPDGVRSVAFSPDGRYLAVGSRSGHLTQWDRGDRSDFARPPARWPAHCADEATPADVRVGALAYSADSRRLYSGSSRVVRGWDAAKPGECVFHRVGADLPLAPQLPAGGAILADIESAGRPVHRFDAIRGVVGAPLTGGGDPGGGGALLGPGGNLAFYLPPFPGAPVLSDLRAGGFRAAVSTGRPADGPARVTAGAFLAGVGYAVTAEEHEHRVKIWDVAAARLLVDRPHPDGSLRLAADPTGARVAVAEADCVRVYELTGGAARPVAVGPWPAVAAVAARGGELATLALTAGGGHAIAHWPDAGAEATPRLAHFPGLPARFALVALPTLPGGGGPVSAANAAGRHCCVLTPGGPARLDVADLVAGPDGRVWALDENELRAYSLPGWTPGVAAPLPEWDVGYRAVAIDRERAVAGRRDGALVAFDPETGAPGAVTPGPEAVQAVALAPGGDALVGGEFGQAWVVAAGSGAAHSWEAHAGAVRGVAHAGDGLVTASSDATVKFWLRPGDSLFTWRPGGGVRQLRVDGQYVYALVDNERGVRRLDLERLRAELGELGLGF